MRHVLTLFDLSTNEIEAIFALAETLKKALAQGIREPRFAGHVQALLFEKPSLRTRVSFETAFAHLGGTTMYLGADVGWGHRESPADFSRVLTPVRGCGGVPRQEHQRGWSNWPRMPPARSSTA